ncbi:hypothetical protein K438DRAFT_1974447 [Mycena galopus ATCC 62051]|nr:hypothetical protein K438DRAFT_1974447 [Mycena galopus ATCC 62051]
MPPSSSVSGKQILEYTAAAANALQDVATASGIPFLGCVCNLTLGIVPMIQETKFHKGRCLQIADDVHHLLCALMVLSISEEDIQAPRMLERISKCTLTLQKIDSCLRAQQDVGRLKRLFKQSELAAQLQNCGTELKELLNTFMITQEAAGIDIVPKQLIWQTIFNWTEFPEYKLWLILIAPSCSQDIPRA